MFNFCWLLIIADCRLLRSQSNTRNTHQSQYN